ncbi:hypothetical protein FRC01_005412 [Tulasnella sp. 417]|nr:hypothetical protein FRC01_005412 [Tulasnella sp. 417]
MDDGHSSVIQQLGHIGFPAEVLRTDTGELDYDNDRAESVLPLTKTCRNFHRIFQPLLFETITPSEPKLWIWSAVISRALSVHFQQCPRLEKLFLWEVTITNREPTISSFRSLKYLRYKQGQTNCFTSLSLPNLETLRIDSEFIDSRHLSGTMEDHQIFQFDPAVLKTLIVFAPFYLINSMQAGLLGLLGRTTQLRSLELPQDEFNDSFNVPNDLIPNLEIFDGPVNLDLKFCKGRPVRDLRMTIPERGDWERNIDVPSLVTPGSVPLEHLSITGCEWEDDTMEHIARRCPEPVSLTIRADYVTGALSIRHPLPKLRSATFVTTYASWCAELESEEGIVRDCKEFWTELEYLRFLEIQGSRSQPV